MKLRFFTSFVITSSLFRLRGGELDRMDSGGNGASAVRTALLLCLFVFKTITAYSRKIACSFEAPGLAGREAHLVFVAVGHQARVLLEYLGLVNITERGASSSARGRLLGLFVHLGRRGREGKLSLVAILLSSLCGLRCRSLLVLRFLGLGQRL